MADVRAVRALEAEHSAISGICEHCREPFRCRRAQAPRKRGRRFATAPQRVTSRTAQNALHWPDFVPATVVTPMFTTDPLSVHLRSPPMTLAVTLIARLSLMAAVPPIAAPA